MPVDDTDSGVISGIGSSVNGILAYNGADNFSVVGDENKQALKEYDLKSYDFKTLNTTEKGVLFSGFFNSGLLYRNPMNIYRLEVTVGSDENKEIELSAPDLEEEIYEILSSGWVYKDGENYYYAETAGFKFEVIEDGQSKKLKISNTGGKERTIEKLLYVPSENTIVETDNLKKLSSIDIKSLKDIYDNIGLENVCYKSLEDGSKYYYNPIKMLD